MALLANPTAYDGKRIRVDGYFDGSHFETCLLFLSKGDFDYFIARNAVYVRWPGCLNPGTAAKVQRRYARVEGVFEADIGAGFGSYSAIQEVREVLPLPSRAQSQESWRAPWWLELWPWLPLGLVFVAATTMATYWFAKRRGPR